MAAPAAKKSNTGKLVFVVVALSLACVSIAWQFGLFGGGNASKPDPNAPPAVAETPEEKQDRQEVEGQLKEYTDSTGETPAGS